MKNKLIAAVAVLTLGASFAVAAPEGGKSHRGKRGGRGHFSAKLAQKLNLTDAQKEQIRAIKKETREQNASFFQTYRRTREELRAAREANDTARATSLAATLESQHAQMKQLRAGEKQRVLSVLSAEQRTQLEQMKSERGGKRQRQQ